MMHSGRGRPGDYFKCTSSVAGQRLFADHVGIFSRSAFRKRVDGDAASDPSFPRCALVGQDRGRPRA